MTVASTDIYADFAPFYDLYSADRGEDIPLYLELASSAPGPILELGCGTGRVTIPLAQAGHEVLGLDVSESMLEIAVCKLRQLPLEISRRIRLEKMDMRRFRLGRRFGLVIIPWYSFNYLLDHRDRIACLKAVRQHLAPGGTLALDLFVPLTFTKEPVPEFKKRREVTIEDGSRIVFVDRRTYNPSTRIEMREHKYIATEPEGEDSEYTFTTQRYYCDGLEITQCLVDQGFNIRACWGGYDKRHFREAESNIFVIADLTEARTERW
jgi:SAM-dependent methyltransferase